MAKKLDPRLLEILTAYGERPEEALWDCHGTWVAYHKAIERIAAKAGVAFDMPQIIEANSADRVVAIAVKGKMGDNEDYREEWSFGEASPGNNKNAYPYAMAEKRAKDRVVLKLIGLHGLVYSEEESDDFKPKRQQVIDTKYGEVDADWTHDNTVTPTASSAELKRQGVMEEFSRELDDVSSLVGLTAFKIAWRKKAKAEGFNYAFLATMKDQIERREGEIMAAMSPEALAEVPLKDALKASVINAG